MAKPLIPTRPADFLSPLLQNEQQALSYYVVFACGRSEAFLKFVRPDIPGNTSKPAVDEYIKQFFARKEVREYLEAYQKTIDAFLHPAPAEEETQKLSLEERKAKAKAKAMEFAMDLANNIEQAEDPEVVLKLMDKVGLLDGDEQVEEAPRRYIPVSCNECAYRKFVEENCDIVDDGTELDSKSNQ